MKRGWNTLSNPEARGTEESYRLANALAAISEPEFLESILNVKSSLNEWGGQYMVAAQRERVNVHGQRDPEGPAHATIGLVHHYKHVPDQLKDALRSSEPSPDSLEHVEPIDWMENLGPEDALAADEMWPEFTPEEVEDTEAQDAAIARAEAAADDPGDPDEMDRRADREHAIAESSE